MKKFFTRIACAMLLGGVALSANAATEVEYTMGEEFDLTQTTYAVYEATQDGVLKATFSTNYFASPATQVLYLFPEAGVPGGNETIYVAGLTKANLSSEETSGSGITAKYLSQSFDVLAGTKYLVYRNGDLTLTLSFEAGEVTDPKDSAIDISLPGSATIGGDNKIGKLIVETAGILTVTTQANLAQNQINAVGDFLKTADDQPVNSTVGTTGFMGWINNSGTYTAIFNVEPGTYYVYYPFDTAGLFTFSFIDTEDVVVAIQSLNYSAGNIIDSNSETLKSGLTISFSPVETTVGSAQLNYISNGEEKTAGLIVQNFNGSWTIGAKMEDGSDIGLLGYASQADKNTMMYVVLNDVEWNGKPATASNIESNYIAVDNGTITITYSAEGDPFTLVSQTYPTAISSYMNPDNENGYATLTFNYPLKTLNASLLFYSNYVIGGMVEVPGQYEVPVIFSEDRKTATLNFTNVDYTQIEGYTPLSTYSLIIQGVVAENGLKYPSYVKQINYDASSADTAPTEMTGEATMITPSSQYVLEAENVIVTWNYSEIELTSDYGFATLVIGSGAEQSCEIQAISVNDADYANALEIILPASLKSVSGTYTFNLPANIVKNEDNEVNKAQSFTYTVPTLDNTYSLAGFEEDGAYAAEDLEEVSIYWPYLAAGEELSAGIATQGITVTPEGGSASAVNATLDGNAIIMDLSELSEGIYTLNVPVGYVWVGEALNPAIAINFTVDNSNAINAIGAELNGVEAIYNLQGQKVNANNLKKGIYIINGKKVLVK